MSYGTPYIATPITAKAVGRPEMTKSTITEQPKAARKYAKTRGEHYKDMVIVALIAGLIAFVGGMHFSNQQHSQVANAVKNAVAPSVSAQAPTSK